METKQNFYIFESDGDMVRPIFKNYNDALVHLFRTYNEKCTQIEAEALVSELETNPEMTAALRAKLLRFIRAIKYDFNTALSQGYIEEIGYITNGEVIS